MSTPPDPVPPRALVLGGGGLAGIAWEIGVLVGLAENGVDVAAAERVQGTSAGAVVGALIATGVDLAAVHESHGGVTAGGGSGAPGVSLAERFAGAPEVVVSGDRADPEVRAAVGAWAIAVDTVAESERREIIAARLPDHRWPDPSRVDLRITAVDAHSGEAVVFTAADGARGVGLVDAVAASCAVPGVWPPVTISGRRYVDGGVRSIVGVDVIDRGDGPTPAGPVLVLAPLDPPGGGPKQTVAAEVERRRTEYPDAAVLAVLADAEALDVFGPDVLDPASMPAAAAAGRRQGRAVAADVAAVWHR